MWYKVIATGAVFLRPPFELSLERTLTIGAIMSAPGKRTPLADRKLIHVGFTFHLIVSPTENCAGQDDAIHSSEFYKGKDVVSSCLICLKPAFASTLLSNGPVMNFKIRQNLTV